jgi:hypothetical protein
MCKQVYRPAAFYIIMQLLAPWPSPGAATDASALAAEAQRGRSLICCSCSASRAILTSLLFSPLPFFLLTQLARLPLAQLIQGTSKLCLVHQPGSLGGQLARRYYLVCSWQTLQRAEPTFELLAYLLVIW